MLRRLRTADRTAGEAAQMRARRAERTYGSALRRVARMVGDIVEGHDISTPEGRTVLEIALRSYGETLRPWAEAVGRRMLTDTDTATWRAWSQLSREMGRSLRVEIEQGATGRVMRERLAAQVDLITSLPREAAARVHRIAQEGLINGERADSIAAKIMETGEVTRSRADLIARTEVGRTATELTRARAESVGSTGYIWTTIGDRDVRHSHRRMNGQFVRWDSPPTLDGLTGHAGALPNCRCLAMPVLPGDD